MVAKDDFDGQISMFGMDDMEFEPIGITGGADFFDEDEIVAEKKVSKKKEEPVEEVVTEEVEESVEATDTPQVTVRKPSLPKLKIEGVFPCMGCGKLLTKTVEGDKFKAFCNCCNVSYSGNN